MAGDVRQMMRTSRLLAELGFTSTVDALEELKRLRSGQAATHQLVARLHVTETGEYPDIRVEVLNGEQLQPSDSPIDVYIRVEPCDHEFVMDQEAPNHFCCQKCPEVRKRAGAGPARA